jgi:hypothetical protein
MLPRQFYATDWVAGSLVNQFKHRYVTVRFDYGMRRHYSEDELHRLNVLQKDMWGSGDNPFFEIHSYNGKADDPTDVSYFIARGAVEFIPEVSYIYDIDRTDTIIVDLDPKDPVMFSFEDTRGATQVVTAALLTKGSPLDKAVVIEEHKYRFSGNRSFHLYIKLSKPHPFEYLRNAVKMSLDVVTEMYPQLSYKNYRSPDNKISRTDYILVDIGALSRHRVVRALWSMHAKTGLVCVPVQDIKTFDRSEADPSAVLSKGFVAEKF